MQFTKGVWLIGDSRFSDKTQAKLPKGSDAKSPA
jgi:hypothetical protein